MTNGQGVAVRDAATIILVRDAASSPKILMGQRGKNAAFMPSKFVFPGGAVDTADRDIDLARPIPDPCNERLRMRSPGLSPDALAVAAIRELWEETGLILGAREDWNEPVPDDWKNFHAEGFRPDASGLSFIFRAITPPGNTRRFDARFFLCDAANICGDPDDFSHASDELSTLQWIGFDEVRSFDLPFITEVVLSELANMLPQIGPPSDVPFFDTRDEERFFERLKGLSPLDQTRS